MKRLDGKIAIVTGAGRGIGRCIALKLASEGAEVVLNDLDSDPVKAVAREIRELGSVATEIVGSITDPAMPKKLVEAAVDKHKGLDIVINNAGYTWDAVIQKMTDEQFQAMMDIHVMAPFRLLREAIEPMRSRAKRDAEEGREVFRKVVNISSGVVFGSPGQVNYSSAKAAVIGLTRTLAKEWGRYKINVNAVAFGIIETRLTQPVKGEKVPLEIDGHQISIGVPEQFKQHGVAAVPLGRGGKPEEAAGAVAMLCYPEADYVSGQILVCDGALI